MKPAARDSQQLARLTCEAALHVLARAIMQFSLSGLIATSEDKDARGRHLLRLGFDRRMWPKALRLANALREQAAALETIAGFTARRKSAHS